MLFGEEGDRWDGLYYDIGEASQSYEELIETLEYLNRPFPDEILRFSDWLSDEIKGSPRISVPGVSAYWPRPPDSPMERDLAHLAVWDQLLDDERRSAKRGLEELESAIDSHQAGGPDFERASLPVVRDLDGLIEPLGIRLRGLASVHILTGLYHAAVQVRAADFDAGDTQHVFERLWKQSSSWISHLQRVMRKFVAGRLEGSVVSAYDTSLDAELTDSAASVAMRLREVVGGEPLLDRVEDIEVVEAAIANIASQVNFEKLYADAVYDQLPYRIFRKTALACKILIDVLSIVATAGGSAGASGPRAAVGLSLSLGRGGGIAAVLTTARVGSISARTLAALGVRGAAAADILAVFSSSTDGPDLPKSKSTGGRGTGDPTPRERTLGTDPKNRQFRQAEADAARRLEEGVGPLKRDPTGAGDWIDEAGRVYDAVGPIPDAYFDLQQVARSIRGHLLKHGVDTIVVDVTGLTASKAARIRSFISGLDAGSRSRIIVQGG